MDLVRILKYAPEGTILYSTVYGEVKLRCIVEGDEYPIIVNAFTSAGGAIQVSFTSDGRYRNNYSGECVIFPSQVKRDWDDVCFRKLLPINTPVVVIDDDEVKASRVQLRYYAGGTRCWDEGRKGTNYNCERTKHLTTAWTHIIPVECFNFDTLEFKEEDDYGTGVTVC